MSDSVERYRQIGRIAGAKGVRGELKIVPESDEPGRLLELKHVFIGDESMTAQSFEIASATLQTSRKGVLLVVRLQGVDDRTTAENIGRSNVFALESDLPVLKENEHYVSDLVGMDVALVDGSPLGTVIDVYDLPGQDILVVRTGEDGQAMIPIVPEFVRDVDLVSHRIVVRPIEGLL